MALIDKNYIRLSQLRVAMQNMSYNENEKSYKKNKAKIHQILASNYSIDFAVPAGSLACKHSPQLKGCTALHFAVTSEQLDIVKLLLSKNANITHQAANGFTPLRLALEFMKNFQINKNLKSHILMKIANELLTAHPNRKDNSNPTCRRGISHFHIACMMGCLETVDFYIKASVDVNQAVSMKSTIFPGFTPLHFAIQYGHKDVVEMLLNHEASVKLRDGNCMMPLQLLVNCNMRINDWNMSKLNIDEWEYFVDMELATLIDNDSIMDMLVPEEKHLEEVDENELSYFHAVCTKRNENSIKKLLELGFDINEAINFEAYHWPGYTPLHFAARCSNKEIVMLLLQSGAKIDAKDANGITAFDLCVERFSPSELSLILKTQPSLKSIQFGHMDLVDLLDSMSTVFMFDALEVNVNSHVSHSSALWPGYSLLHLVVALSKRYIKYKRRYFVAKGHSWEQEVISCTSNSELVKACLQRGPDLKIQDARGMTPLDLAFRLRKVEVLKQLPMAFAKAVATSQDYRKQILPFHLACAVDNEVAVQMFLENGMDPNMQLHNDELWCHPQNPGELVTLRAGSSLFHTAAIVEANNVLKICREMQVDVNVLDADGLTPAQLSFLHFGSRDTLKLLLSFPEARKINTMSKSQLSQLHVACFIDDVKAVEELLNASSTSCGRNQVVCQSSDPYANVLAKYKGYTPLHFAVEANSKEIVDLLLSRGHDVFVKNKKGLNALHLALLYLQRTYESGVLQRLVDQVINKDFNDEYGITKLHLACATCDQLLIADLFESEKDLDCCISFGSPVYPGDTPHHFLARHNKTFSMFNFQADLTKRNADSLTPLHMCGEISPFLLKSSTKKRTIFPVDYNFFASNPKTTEGVSHFHISCFNSWDFINKFLIKGVDVNEPIDHFIDERYAGYTPLHIALHQGDEKTATLLLEYGADICFEGADCLTPFDLIRLDYGKTCIEAFLSSYQIRKKKRTAGIFGRQINLLKPPFDKMLSTFVFRYNPRRFNELLFKTEGVKNVCGRRPDFLFKLSEPYDPTTPFNDFNDLACNIKTLIQISGCDLDYTNKYGETVLHKAVSSDNNYLVRALLHLGAEIDIMDNNGKSVCDNYISVDLYKKWPRLRFPINSIWKHISKMVALDMDLNNGNRKKYNEICSHYTFKNTGDASASMLKEYKINSFSLYDILTGSFLRNFRRLPASQRESIISYLKDKSSDESLLDWQGIFNMQQNRLQARLNLLEPATDALFLHIKLPFVCVKNIIKYLSNEDLKAVIKL